MSHTYEFARPALTVDIVVFGLDEEDLQVMLIQRDLAPFEGGWALPGGFVRVDETLDDAARRELVEETGLKDIYLEQLYTFGAVERDPRERVVTVAYYALVNLEGHHVQASTDARNASWFPVSDLPELAFDHQAILDAAHERLRGKVRYQPIGFELLPERFTLRQIQHMYEVILDRELDKRNFRKKVLAMEIVKETKEIEKDVAHRAARLYRFDKRTYDRLTKQGFNFEIQAMTLYPHILGCLLGTAVGDAVGLRREGLAPRRATKLYGDDVSPALFAGFGVCSDDTEHTVMVARSLAIANHDPEAFERLMASQLKRWLLAAPAGVGLATLRACLKLLVGFGPGRSGVFSAGNGPAMRSALIGVASRSDAQCEEFVRRSTRLTHADPKAEEGALVVARAAGLTARGKPVDPSRFLGREAERIKGPELCERLAAAHCALVDGLSPAEFAESQGWTNGIGGYVNQTVPAALYCWASSPNDYRQSVTRAVLLGGDTDSVAAITGAIAGANLGDAAIPSKWVAGLTEWPRDVNWIEQAAKALAENLAGQRYTNPPPMHWLATLPRNAVFAAIALGMGFRRLLPPY